MEVAWDRAWDKGGGRKGEEQKDKTEDGNVRTDFVPGANTQDPTYDKVTRRKPDRQGRSGFQGFRKAAPQRSP